MIAAGLESLLIFLVFIVISGLSTWLQKRRQAGEDQSDWVPGEEPPNGPHRQGTPQPPPVSPRRPMPAPLQNWEEELRRLLEGDRPQPPEPPPQAAPPPLPSSSSRPQPVPIPASSERRRTVPLAPAHAEIESPRASRLEDSDQAYRLARHRQAEAAARLREAQAKTARHHGGYQGTESVSRGRDILAARALLSKPSAARQAVIASVILGRPKGLSRPPDF
jgi:hypothetical protein